MFPERPAGQGQGEDSGFSNKENVGGGLTQSPQKHGRESREQEALSGAFGMAQRMQGSGGRGHCAGEAELSKDSNAESWAVHTAVGRAGHLSLIYVLRGSDAASPVLAFGIHEANET